MAITLTTNAARHVEKMLQKHASAVGLRLGTRKSGCTGFAYVVDYAETVENDDIVFESNGIKIIVDKDSLGNIQGHPSLTFPFTSWLRLRSQPPTWPRY